MLATKPNVFNIPASAPFLRTLFDALLNGTLVAGFPAKGDPLALAQATLYLPTRRACRLAREAFLEASGGEAAILPRIVALGDVDEDEIVFADAAAGDLAQPALDLPETIAPLERRLLLAQLISGWAASRELHAERGTPLVANTPASALALADDLARLMDDMTTRGVSWDKLDGLVPEEFDKFWQLSLQLLKIIRDKWPGIRGEAIEPAERRDRLIEAETQRLKTATAPVIAAGSTGSMPATAKLLAAIATLPHGAIVLPGLDVDLDEGSWRAIAHSGDGEVPASGQPQFAMQALLARIGIARSDVKTLGRAVRREAFMSEAMRPAGTTELWPKRLQNKDFQAAIDASVENLTLIEAANAEEEALAVAIALREAALEPGKTAALVTPDRALARRVTAALSRWNIEVDDSGGDRLADTPAGLFARLAVEAAIGGLEPVTLLALLKHPLFRFGAAANVHDRAIAALERAVLRGPRPKPGSAGLAHALATYDETRSELHRNDPRKLVSRDDLAAARALVDRLAQALASLEDLKRGEHVLSDLAARHRHVVMALSDAVFSNADGTRLQTVFDDLLNTQAATQMKVAPRDYPEVFEAIAAAGTVRMREKPDVRIRILGPLEARLQPFDRVVLGGLNEDTWPPDAHSDPWLSRPMRQKLGLNLPELRIGLAAHDFEQALGNHEVVITRAMKVAGSPTVTSRFVQRMAALAGERWNGVIKRGKHYLDLARALDAPEEVKAAPRPAPSPPLDVRPGQLSVTEIENWLRDPYTIYAKHVLRLFPLEPIDTAPGAADRGSIIHDAIGKFTGQFASGLPPDPERELTRLGEQSFKPMQDMPEARAFWWPRFKRIASWFAAWERSRRPTLKALYAEITGKMSVPLGNTRTFVLTARADRIELRQDGTYAILDYKTGQPPTEPQVRTGLAPQLTLETAILNSGGFENVAAGSVTEIKYVRLRGGEPPGEEKPIDFKKNGTPDSQAEYAKKRLAGVAAKFLIEGEPYRSLVHPMWAKHYGDYDHLARVKEWAASGGESEYEGPPS